MLDTFIVPQGQQAVPAGSVRKDPVAGLPVRKMVDKENTRFNRTDYSRRRCESNNGTYFFTYHGTAKWHVYKRETLELVRVLDAAPGAELKWASDHELIRIGGVNSYVGKLSLYKFNLLTDTEEKMFTINPFGLQESVRGRSAYLHTGEEGTSSMGYVRFAYMCFDADEKLVGICSYDRHTGELHELTMSHANKPDHISISPTGKYIVVSHLKSVDVYDFELKNKVHLFDKSEHSDIALGVDGDDYYVHIDFSGDGWMTSVNLRTKERKKLFRTYSYGNPSIHVSGKAFDRPGWVVYSTYKRGFDSNKPMMQKIFISNLHTGEVRMVCSTENEGDDYWEETHGNPNLGLTRIYFNSDSMRSRIKEDVECMCVELPDDLSELPLLDANLMPPVSVQPPEPVVVEPQPVPSNQLDLIQQEVTELNDMMHELINKIENIFK